VSDLGSSRNAGYIGRSSCNRNWDSYGVT